MKRKMICFIFIIITVLSLVSCGKSNSNIVAVKETRNMTDNLEHANQMYQDGDYEQSLSLYLDEVTCFPQNVIARVGAARCQMKLENYDMAAINLYSALYIDPYYEDTYEAYLELSESADAIGYAKTAVENAYRYQIESILERVPKSPDYSLDSGEYDERLNLELSSEENGEIYYTLTRDESMLVDEALYSTGLPVTYGKTEISAYVVKNGIPSKESKKVYYCEYNPTVVTFDDPLIEQLVRITLDKATEPVTDIECESIRGLNFYDLNSVYDDYMEYQSLRINTLSDLQKFPNLTVLTLLNQDKINDYSELKSCVLLDGLCLDECKVGDLSFLEVVPNITSLSLGNCNIQDLTPILKCKNLSALYINGNASIDSKQLGNMNNLQFLCLNDSQITDYSMLQNSKITSLQIVGYENLDYSKISQLDQLTSLTITRDYNIDNWWNREGIKDISFLQNMPNLNYLYLGILQDLWSVDVDYICNLKELKTLYLYNRNEDDSQKDVEVINTIQERMPDCTIGY